MDRTLRTWDITKGREGRTLRGHGAGVSGVAFSHPDQKSYVSASWDCTLKLWDIDRDAERFTLQGHTAPVLAVAFAKNAATIASASQDGTVRLWRAAARRVSIPKHP